MSVIAFTKVKLPYGWLGNMAPFPLVHGSEWRTSEALFQALRFADVAIQEQIRSATSPMTAKLIARSHADKMVIQPRSQDDLNVMGMVLELKLNQHPHLVKMLADTGDALIIEDESSRRKSGLFWGMAKNPDGTWEGQNMLGKIWMNIRNNISKDSAY